jgi:HicB family
MHMDINPLIESLRRDLVTAAEAGGTEVREAAERLAFALEPAVRLTLMDALTQAADVISTELAGTAVEVRLKGREPVFVVTGSTEAPEPEPVPGSVDEQVDVEEEEGALVRITLRIPESLKAKAEELAARRGQSLNTWLVNAARVASIGIDVSGWGFASPPGVPPRRPGKRIQGWVR